MLDKLFTFSHFKIVITKRINYLRGAFRVRWWCFSVGLPRTTTGSTGRNVDVLRIHASFRYGLWLANIVLIYFPVLYIYSLTNKTLGSKHLPFGNKHVGFKVEVKVLWPYLCHHLNEYLKSKHNYLFNKRWNHQLNWINFLETSRWNSCHMIW